MKLLNTPIRVHRTSLDWALDNSSPCEGAVRQDDGWFISFASVEEFQEFVEANGDVVLLPPDTLEIYDGYRE